MIINNAWFSWLISLLSLFWRFSLQPQSLSLPSYIQLFILVIFTSPHHDHSGVSHSWWSLKKLLWQRWLGGPPNPVIYQSLRMEPMSPSPTSPLSSPPPVLKVCAHGAHVRGTKASWRDQKASGPENLLALRAEGTGVSRWPSNVGDKTIQF